VGRHRIVFGTVNCILAASLSLPFDASEYYRRIEYRNVFDSMRVNSESISNEIDERDQQYASF
jgi:hypothetical protein